MYKNCIKRLLDILLSLIGIIQLALPDPFYSGKSQAGRACDLYPGKTGKEWESFQII